MNDTGVYPVSSFEGREVTAILSVKAQEVWYYPHLSQSDMNVKLERSVIEND
jgi:hypothetical protein